mgnify:CR=1 FL=1
MNYGLKQALKVLIALACGVSVTAASISINNKNNSKTLEKNEQISETVKTPDYTPISKTESQVGKYADIDGDGTVDGIIFADLMVGGSGIWNEYDTTAEWANTQGTYVIPTVSSTKDYYVSQESYTNKLGGTAEVLTPIGNGNDRFYIMALTSKKKNVTFYKNGVIPLNENFITSSNFGSGRQNTINMLNKWKNDGYGPKDDNDLWNYIQDDVKKGWFVPSSQELAAFGKNLNITRNNNFKTHNILPYIWTSTQEYIHNSKTEYGAYIGDMVICLIGRYESTRDNFGIRLAHTF